MAGQCLGCGGNLDETTRYEGRPHDHWEAEPATCGRCYVRRQAESIYADAHRDAPAYGTLWRITDKRNDME